MKLNVMALVDSKGFDAERLAQGVDLADYGLQLGDLTELKRLFEHATTFGSLIQVPKGLAAKLPALKQLSEAPDQDLFESGALKWLGLLVRQAEMLTAQYDAVVANPPYMGSKGLNAPSEEVHEGSFYRARRADLFACFIDVTLHSWRRKPATLPWSRLQSWMFLSSFDQLRNTDFAGKDHHMACSQWELAGLGFRLWQLFIYLNACLLPTASMGDFYAFSTNKDALPGRRRTGTPLAIPNASVLQPKTSSRKSLAVRWLIGYVEQFRQAVRRRDAALKYYVEMQSTGLATGNNDQFLCVPGLKCDYGFGLPTEQEKTLRLKRARNGSLTTRGETSENGTGTKRLCSTIRQVTGTR